MVLSPPIGDAFCLCKLICLAFSLVIYWFIFNSDKADFLFASAYLTNPAESALAALLIAALALSTFKPESAALCT